MIVHNITKSTLDMTYSCSYKYNVIIIVQVHCVYM